MSGTDSRGEPSAKAAAAVGGPGEPPNNPEQAPVKEPLQTPYGDPPVREPQPEPTPGGDPPRTEPPLTEPPGGDPPQSVAGISVDTAPDEARRTTPTASDAAGIPVTEPTAVGKPDDFKRIEGIGPKIATALVAYGVLTFDKLASTPEIELRSILSAANVRIVGNVSSSMNTWAEQAGMASRGEWDALKAWQASYKMGKE